MQYKRLRQAISNGRGGGINSGDARGTHLTAEELKTENGVHVRNMTNVLPCLSVTSLWSVTKGAPESISAHPIYLFLLAIVGVTRLFVTNVLPKL